MAKLTLRVKDLVRLEAAIQGCGDIKAVRLGVGLSHNLKAVTEPLESVRKNLKPTEKMNAFNRAAAQLREENATKTQPEQVAAFAALKAKHPEAMADAADLTKRDEEATEMEFEIDTYRIPLAYVPGWFDTDDDLDASEIDAKNKSGVVPFSSLKVLVEFGILYDPKDEPKPEGAVVEPTPIKKAKKA